MDQHQPTVADRISALERHWLDGAAPTAQAIWGQLESTQFVRIDGLAAFWKEDADCRYEQYMEDVVTGCHSLELNFAFLIVGQRNAIQVYVGLQGAPGDSLMRSVLRATFPGIRLAEGPVEHLGQQLNARSLFSHLGRMTGVPTLKASRGQGRSDSVQQIERLVRGLYGEEWGLYILGRPIPTPQTHQLAAAVFEEIRYYSELVKQSSKVRENVTVDMIDRQAQYLVELLEKYLEQVKLGKAQGMWQVDVHLFAHEEAVLGRALALAKAIYAGEDSTPELLRVFRCSSTPGAAPADRFSTVVTSRGLSVLTQLPREEMPGYAVADYARFDVALPATHSVDPVVNIGKVIDGVAPTGNWYATPLADFAKHGLVVGVTGSGKTNTLFYLLDRLWDRGRGVPFLVIEPAKAEYRDLRTAAGFEDLRVFTLGDERIAPFRLNPFEFEIADAENRIHVQTHIDYLKSVFNAAFVLYAPMPYVLETCLHEVYQDRGWDLTTSQNRRLPPQERGREAHWPVFPTLSDLYRKIDEVVDRLGYEERIEMDVKAGLRARIGSLRLGGKGLMLDVRSSVPMAELLSQPAVLELERIGNDEEKAFVIGLLLTRLYEHRVVHARGQGASPLRHVTIIEEAHRLLKNVPSDVGTEEANVRGQAVENFANMLSEIRAYGEGVFIAEQIPSKLTPDAVKNTNLKILHRIVAQDDREMMGGAMNLTEAQKRYVTTLATGQAVVYAEGADRPYLLEIYAYKRHSVKDRVIDRQIRAAMRPFCSQSLYEPLWGYNQWVACHVPADTPLSDVRDMAQAVVSAAEFSETFNRYFLSLIVDPAQAVLGYHALDKLADRVIKPRADQEKAVSLYVMLQALGEVLEDRGRRYGWLYNVVNSLRTDLSVVLADIVATYANRQDVFDVLIARHKAALGEFGTQYRRICARAPVPFAGCAFCPSQCLTRYEVAVLASDPAMQREFLETVRTAKDDAVMWRALVHMMRGIGDRAVVPVTPIDAQQVVLCAATHLGALVGFSAESQRRLVKNIRDMMQTPAAPPSGPR